MLEDVCLFVYWQVAQYSSSGIDLNQKFDAEIYAQHAGITPLALACALNKVDLAKVGGLVTNIIIHTYMHMCVCVVHVCMGMHVYTFIHTCTHTYTHVCKHAHTYMHAHIHTHMYMYICMYTYIHTCVHAYVHMHVDIHPHACMHIQT